MRRIAFKLLQQSMLVSAEDDLGERVLRKYIANYIGAYKVSIMRKKASHKRRWRQRRSWEEFSASLTERQFRRYFRMSRECFDLLCTKIESNVGEGVFKSERYLRELEDTHAPPNSKADMRMRNLVRGHMVTTGGIISGEVRLAITLRMLAGGSYLDLGIIFGTGSTHPYAIFRQVVMNWICDDRLVDISGVEYCKDKDRMNAVAMDFADGSNHLFSGCIGAVDGWIVKIQKPRKKDGVLNPKSFYSRKGFYGLSVQAIVDKKKRVLFRSIESRGAEHDSTAFKRTGLYKWLMDNNWYELKRRGYFFIGDSAYSLRSFLMTPYDNTMHGTPEDNFNYFHSSARIVVECAFGEIDLRWGILWRPLKFALELNCKVIDACMRLHNFIVDFREGGHGSSESLLVERSVFDDDWRRYLATSLEHDPEGGNDGGVYGGERDIRRDGNFEQFRGGRPKAEEADSEAVGRRWRDNIRDEITRRRLIRPSTNWYRSSNCMYDVC